MTETVICYLYSSVHSVMVKSLMAMDAAGAVSMAATKSIFLSQLNILLRNLSVYGVSTTIYCLYRKFKHISITSCVMNRCWLYTYGLGFFLVPFPYENVFI